jgi:hypothetical protein
MWPAFPTSDYYGGSVPSHDQQPTAGLPATGLDSRWGGRSQDGSHVHHQPVDGVGAQLFPGSLATGTPQTFPVASWPATSTGVRVALPSRWLGVRCGPAPIRQISSRFLSCGGSTTGSCNTYTFPSRLPGPGRLAVPTRPVVVGAAPTLPCASRVRLPPASPGRCDSPEVGLPSHPVKWRLVAHEFVEKLLTERNGCSAGRSGMRACHRVPPVASVELATGRSCAWSWSSSPSPNAGLAPAPRPRPPRWIGRCHPQPSSSAAGAGP